MALERRAKLSDEKKVKAFPDGGTPEETLPAIELKNVVTWVNPAFEGRLPFDLTVGKPTRLALFFDGNNDQNPDFELGKRRLHYRSGDIVKAYISDAEGRIVRDIDIKGCGFLRNPPSGLFPAQWRYNKGYDHFGLMHALDAEHDSEVSELFTKHGIRTHRSLAIFRLEELPLHGNDEPGRNTHSIEELRSLGLLQEGIEPVIQMRAFGTKTRIHEVEKLEGSLPALAAVSKLEDAIKLVRFETNGSVKEISAYLKWFATTLGRNVGLMANLGYVHDYLNGHNITLDCRIVDLDSAHTADSYSESDASISTNAHSAMSELETYFYEMHPIFRKQLASIRWDDLSNAYKKAYEAAAKGPFPEW